MRANSEAFERRRLRPRMLRGNRERDLSVTVLGTSSPAPFLLAPVGVLSIAHDEGELAVARASAATGVPLILSSAASHSIEEVAEAMGDAARWFQLYWVNDREVAASLVARAEASGYGAVVVTVDTPMLGWRERDLSKAYLPFLSGEGCAQFFSDPVFRSRLERPPEEDTAGRGGRDARDVPEPRPHVGRPRLAPRADQAAAAREGRAGRRGRRARVRARGRRCRRLEPRRPPGGRLGGHPRRAGRSARRGRSGRGRPDGRRHPPRRGRAEGACARAPTRSCSGGLTPTGWRSAGRKASRPSSGTSWPTPISRSRSSARRARAAWTSRGSRRSPDRERPRGRRARARPARPRRGARPDRGERRLPHRPAHHRDRRLGASAARSCSATRARVWSRRSGRGS